MGTWYILLLRLTDKLLLVGFCDFFGDFFGNIPIDKTVVMIYNNIANSIWDCKGFDGDYEI